MLCGNRERGSFLIHLFSPCFRGGGGMKGGNKKPLSSRRSFSGEPIGNGRFPTNEPGERRFAERGRPDGGAPTAGAAAGGFHSGTAVPFPCS